MKIFAEKTFANCSLVPCQRMPHPQISWRKLLPTATKPRNSQRFSPSKVSRYIRYTHSERKDNTRETLLFVYQTRLFLTLWKVRTRYVDYRIAGNFRGRKLSQISRFCGYSRKFSLQNLIFWHFNWWQQLGNPLQKFSTNLWKFFTWWKFSPSKVPTIYSYVSLYLSAGIIFDFTHTKIVKYM